MDARSKLDRYKTIYKEEQVSYTVLAILSPTAPKFERRPPRVAHGWLHTDSPQNRMTNTVQNIGQFGSIEYIASASCFKRAMVSHFELSGSG